MTPHLISSYKTTHNSFQKRAHQNGCAQPQFPFQETDQTNSYFSIRSDNDSSRHSRTTRIPIVPADRNAFRLCSPLDSEGLELIEINNEIQYGNYVQLSRHRLRRFIAGTETIMKRYCDSFE